MPVENPLAELFGNGPAEKRKVLINVYDIVQPGKLCTFLHGAGVPLVHTGVSIDGMQFEFRGGIRAGETGVCWTKKGEKPNDIEFRCQVFHGFTYCSSDQLREIIREASEEFMCTKYNLFSKNCNHFTLWLCLKLTEKPAPAWINRAAKLGRVFSCVVPATLYPLPDEERKDTTESRLAGVRKLALTYYQGLMETIERINWRAIQADKPGRPSSSQAMIRGFSQQALQDSRSFSTSRSLMTEFRPSLQRDFLLPVSNQDLDSAHYPRFEPYRQLP